MKVKHLFEDSSENSKKLFADAKVKLQTHIRNLKNHIHELDNEGRKIAEKRLKKYEDDLKKWNKKY
jgi:hypothetical protein